MAAPEARRARLVLVVDDEPILLALMERALREAGYPVLSAPNGREALRLVLQAVTPPGILVTDIRMDGLNGAALAALITARYSATRVLLVSAGDPEYRQVPWPFLRKPFTLDQLIDAVDGLLEGQQPTAAQG
jgi:DNA-binding NtrC family response regulator